MARIIKTKGFVLNTTPFKESSLFASILTCDHGKIRVLAKGCRRPKSKMCGALERFTFAEFIYYKRETKDVYTLSDANILDDYSTIRGHPAKVHAVLVLCELFEKVLPPEDRENNAFELLSDFLATIETVADKNVKPLTFLYLLKSLPDAGVRPHLQSCVKCHRTIDYNRKKLDFSISAGGIVCDRDFDDTVITLPNTTITLLTDIFNNKSVPLNNILFSSIARFLSDYLYYHLNGLVLNSLKQLE